jgi:hypothetical protein
VAATVTFPPLARARGPGYWLRLPNLWASRRSFLRADRSTAWRNSYNLEVAPPGDARALPFSKLLGRPAGGGFRFLILADTGEGDRSQYGLLPLIRALAPDFLVINGDVAYPAGNLDDFRHGFFAPYGGLGVPVWAVPGNHEYYSRRHGREFFEVFCTAAHEDEWERAGLRRVPQPGMYWELKEPGAVSLAVIGVDTGMRGRLDRGRRQPADGRQHAWLEERLAEGDREGLAAIVLFHIPGLVRGRHDRRTRLGTLHRLIAAHPCVRLVVCGHEHNFQRYPSGVFRRYLEEVQGVPADAPARPEYVVCGGGGAYLDSTGIGRTRYRPQTVYPSARQWRSYARIGEKLVAGLGWSKKAVGAVVGRLDKAARADADVARYLSMLLVEVGAARVRVRPVVLDDVAALYADLPDGLEVRVDDAAVPVDPAAVARSLREGFTL